MNLSDTRTVTIPEVKHGLFGLGTILYKWDDETLKLSIYINHKPEDFEDHPSIVLTGQRGRKMFLSLFDDDIDVEKLSIEKIFSAIFTVSGFRKEEIISSSRESRLVYARHLAIWAMHEYNRDKHTLTEIGSFFNRDHSSCCYAISKMKESNKYLDAWRLDMKIRFKREIDFLINKTTSHES